MNLIEIATNIFGVHFFEEVNSSKIDSSTNDLKHVISLIEKQMNKILNDKNIANNWEDKRKGRLGPSIVKLSSFTRSGVVHLSKDRLSACARGRFATVDSNTGVYRGKWMYEIQLGRSMFMQIGWATKGELFNDLYGVGDTDNSYGYCGYRQKKWNVTVQDYGEKWSSGDIIGCTIDYDERKLVYYRNGRSLGVAFDKITTGPGCVYFPAFTMHESQYVKLNFGSTPMQYPVEGYQLLQEAPISELQKARILFVWFENLFRQYMKVDNEDEFHTGELILSAKAFKACLARCILKQIGPLIIIPYIIHDVFIPLVKSILHDRLLLNCCLDLMWTFLEEYEMKICLSETVSYFLSLFRKVPIALEFPDHMRILDTLVCLCQHTKTRRYFLGSILFSRGLITHFLNIKLYDDTVLSNIVNKTCHETFPLDVSEEAKKKREELIKEIKDGISGIEKLQIKLLVTLLDNSDGSSTIASSRFIFLKNFQHFLEEKIMSKRIIAHLCQMGEFEVEADLTPSCFYRLLTTFKVLWDAEIGTNQIHVPISTFLDPSNTYLRSFDRLGGLTSYLEKRYEKELLDFFETSDDHAAVQDALLKHRSEPTSINMLSLNRLLHLVSFDITNNPSTGRENLNNMREIPLGPLDSKNSLFELLNGILVLYHVSAAEQIKEVATLRDSMLEYISVLSDSKSKLESTEKLKYKVDENALRQLKKTTEIVNEHAKFLTRKMLVIEAGIYSKEKQETLVWLLKIVMNTLIKASEASDLFCFVPKFYLDDLVALLDNLKNDIDPTVPFDNIADNKGILQSMAQFLCDHFLDPRIIDVESKDLILLCLARFSANPMTLHALENCLENTRIQLVSSLMHNFHNRSWGQCNWILVRFWQGNGFAFRYENFRKKKIVGPIDINSQLTSNEEKNVCASIVFLVHIKEVLLFNNLDTIRILDSIFNQLNWSFSEFVNVIQKLNKSIAIQSNNNVVQFNAREFKLCATCYELSVSLLRSAEMIFSVAPELFSEDMPSSNQDLLVRLCQLCCQILNRMTKQVHVDVFKTLEKFLNEFDLFPMLSAVIGIFIVMLQKDMLLPKSDESNAIPRITRLILSDQSFQMISLYNLFGNKHLNFLEYKDYISEAEIAKVKDMTKHLEFYRKKLSLPVISDNDDNLCTICYFKPASATFKPCNHASCRPCIERHLLNDLSCFFCKSLIVQVVDADGKVIFIRKDQLENP